MPSIPVRWASKYLQLDSQHGKQLTQEKTIQTGSSAKEDCSFGNADDSYVLSPQAIQPTKTYLTDFWYVSFLEANSVWKETECWCTA